MRLLLHGLGVDLACESRGLLASLSEALGVFGVESFEQGIAPIHGVIRPYQQQEVLRYLSNSAVRLNGPDELVEIYQEDERFWMIDDRWGLCELNVLKGSFRSWVLETSSADINWIVEQSIIWPIAQLLRLRGLCLVPAAGVVRDGWGALLVANFNLEPELTALIHAGWRLLGQNWVAIRQDRDQMVMLSLPGRVSRDGQSVDLTAEFCGSSASLANCDAVLLAIPGRRPIADVRRISPTNAPNSVRRAWPIAELHPHRRQGQWPARLAHRCNIFDVQLSRNPREILSLLDLARYHRPVHHPVGELIVA